MTAGGAISGRRERKKRATRARILDAALALFAEHGYEAVKVDDIAARADVANATFFLHFPTKASLISAFNDEVSAKIAERLSGFDFSAVEKLELLRAVVLDEWRRHGDLLRRLVSDAAGEGGALADAAHSLVALVEGIIAEGQRTGEFDSEFDPAIAAGALAASWRAAMLQWAASGDGARAVKANRQALDLILRGLRKT